MCEGVGEFGVVTFLFLLFIFAERKKGSKPLLRKETNNEAAPRSGGDRPRKHLLFLFVSNGARFTLPAYIKMNKATLLLWC
jgi:hypothetical protein